MPSTKIIYGGDYNPEQWSKDIWTIDMELFKKAGINTATINVFSWARLMPDEDTFNFEELDQIVNMLEENGIGIIMATSTAAMPAWMVKKYPDVARVDFEGRRRKFGGRHNHCPSSPNFKRIQKKLVEEIARRYGQRESIKLWHISNEYSGFCYCEECEKNFRKWLKEKYGTIEAVNKAWNSAFWSHTFYDFDEIVAPNHLGDGMSSGNAVLSGLSLDYQRFMSDALLQNFKDEKEIIRKYDKETPVTTNLMAGCKDLDYYKWAKEMDVISWDNYPSLTTSVSLTAMNHDLMRSLKEQQPFILMEQTPNMQNWQPYNSCKRPGMMESMSYQTMAHGADDILFFQLRQSRNGCEKFHGAVISHRGKDDTRTFKECERLGKNLSHLGEIRGAKTPAKAAVLFDYPSWWAIGYASGPSILLDYQKEVHRYYKALFERQIDVDIVSWHSDFSKYECVFAPCAYIAEDFTKDKIEDYLKSGGRFITTTMSGMTDETDNIHLGGYPGLWKELAGMYVEEIDALLPENKVPVLFENGEEAKAEILADVIHLEGAKALAIFNGEYYKGLPAVTVNRYEKGQFFYVGSMLDEKGMELLMDEVLKNTSIKSLKYEGVEIKTRMNENGTYHFVLNLEDASHEVELPFEGTDLISGKKISNKAVLAPYQSMIIKE